MESHAAKQERRLGVTPVARQAGRPGSRAAGPPGSRAASTHNKASVDIADHATGRVPVMLVLWMSLWPVRCNMVMQAHCWRLSIDPHSTQCMQASRRAHRANMSVMVDQAAGRDPWSGLVWSNLCGGQRVSFGTCRLMHVYVTQPSMGSEQALALMAELTKCSSSSCQTTRKGGCH